MLHKPHWYIQLLSDYIVIHPNNTASAKQNKHYCLYGQFQYLPSGWGADNIINMETMLFSPQAEVRISDSASFCPRSSTLWMVCGPLGHIVNFVEPNISHFKFSQHLYLLIVHINRRKLTCTRQLLCKIITSTSVFLFDIYNENKFVFCPNTWHLSQVPG